VAGKRLIFEASDVCNGMPIDGVFDFSQDGTELTSPIWPDLKMVVYSDPALPGILRLIDQVAGTDVNIGLSADGSLDRPGSTMFFVTSSLNVNLPNGQGRLLNPHGGYTLKTRPSSLSECKLVTLDPAEVGVVQAASNGVVKVWRKSAGESPLYLGAGSPVLEGDMILIDYSENAKVDFYDGSNIYLTGRVVVEIRDLSGETKKSVAKSIEENDSLWGRDRTCTLEACGSGPGLIAGGVRG